MATIKSIKTQLIIFLICFAGFLSVQEKDFLWLLPLLIAVLAAVSTETGISYFRNRKFAVSESALVTGLIIGYVLSSDSPWWVFIFASVSAILSKYIFRFKSKHIFNPAAFAIFLVTVLCGAATQWKGTYVWFLLLPFGLYFIYKIKKIELVCGYALSTFLFFGIQAFYQKAPWQNVFGYLSFFFICIMLIEPKTTPTNPRGKFIFGFSAGALIFMLTEIGVKVDVELLSLLLMNISTPLLNKLFKTKGGSR